MVECNDESYEATGPNGWLSRQRHLPTSVTSTVQFPGSTWWKERAVPATGPPITNTSCDTHTHTIKQTTNKPKLMAEKDYLKWKRILIRKDAADS